MSRRRSATLVRALVASAWGIVSLATGPVRADTLPRVQVLRDVSSAVGAVGSQLLPRPDGGVIVLGRNGGGANSAWIAELSPTGDVERQVRVVAATGVAFINAIAATPDGGLVLAGGIQASSPVDFLVVKLDANWAIQWQLSRGASLTDEIAQGVQPTVDGGWLVHGTGPAGALLLRLDASGGVIWQRQCVSPGARFSAQKLSPLGSDQWIMASNVSGSISGILVARLESDGTIDAARTLDSRGGFDLLGDVQALPDGGAWIVGETTAADGFTERATILRLDSNLLHRWARGYKLWFTSMRFVTSMPTGVGGLITAGYAYVNTEPAVNAVVLEVDDAGNATMWSTFGGSEDDLITNVARVRGRWVVTGSTASMDGAASPDTAWLVALNEVLRPPTDCGLAVVESVFPADASVMATWVTITTEDATALVSSGLTVTLETALLDSSIECVGPTLPPSEVSPPGSWTPLRITASGVLTWEDGALSSSEEFDIRRGMVSSLFGRDYGECLQAGVATPTWTDAEDPPSGDGWYYLVAGRNATGRGPLGNDWLGRQRLASVPCP